MEAAGFAAAAEMVFEEGPEVEKFDVLKTN
jgi:hypothetical protein